MARVHLLTALPLLAFAGLAAGFLLLRGEPSGTAMGYLDRPLPRFEQPPMAGTEAGFKSGDLAGQVTLLNFFAAWCSACRQEHPFLVTLSERGEVPIYGLNWKDARGAGKLFLSKNGNPYSATASDAAGEIGNLLNVTGVPETYVVDAHGRLRYRHLGPLTEEVWAEVLQPLIERLKEET
jgi:cytochrome c biogenesis protein CcmG/thiol:disulfide interchange protein DsbE